MVTETKNDDDDDDESDDDDDAREVWYADGAPGYMFSARLFLEDDYEVKVTIFTVDDYIIWKAEKYTLGKIDATSGLCVHRK